MFNKRQILKSFVKGEAIFLSIDDVKREATFIQFTQGILTIADTNGNEEEIPMDRITAITL